MLRPLIASVSLLVLVGVTGCSSGGSSGGGVGGGSGGSGGATGGSGGSTGGTAGSTSGGGTGGGTGGGPSCTAGPGYTSTDAPHLVKGLTATIQDLDGNGASNVLAQACGLDICINGSTDANGVVQTCDSNDICIPGIAPNQMIKRPAFKYGDGFGFVKFAELLKTDTEDYVLGIRQTAKLPATSTGAAMEPGTDAINSGIKLTIAAGANIEVDVLVYDTPEFQTFRAAEIPIAKAPLAVDPSLNFEIIVGTTPIETKFCPHAKLTVPNTAGWPPGQAVEVFIHGVSVEEEWAPYAGWAKVSDATVSTDGQSVVTDDGDANGIPYLSVFGFRAKP
jgi:hypothetical protein